MRVGDRVRHIVLGKGSIIDTGMDHEGVGCFLVEFDNKIPRGHDGGGRGKPDHCWLCNVGMLYTVAETYDSIW